MARSKLAEKPIPKLTRKQKKFVGAYLETGNGAHSALTAYDTKDYNTAASLASENLRKPNIRAYLEDRAEKAVEMVYQLSQEAVGEAIRLNASKDILDRAGYAAMEKSVVMNINYTPDPKSVALANEFEAKLKGELKAPGIVSDDITGTG